MNEEHKIEMDELISLYLDGEATQRQETELKRLMQHDSLVQDRVKALKHQQQTLNALPVETAPENLLDDIRCEMERKSILNGVSDNSKISAATTHLFARRLMASAAMLLLPLGLLAVVVFQIFKQPVDGPLDYDRSNTTISQTKPVPSSDALPALSSELPFNGVLVLKTDQYMPVSTTIKEAIDKQGLLAQAFPERAANVTRFYIKASPKKVAELLDSLTPVRAQCRTVTLQIPGPGTNDEAIEISEPQAKQITTLVFEDSPQMFDRLASRYAAANQKNDSAFAKNDDDSQLDESGYPSLSIPTLAGDYDQQNKTVQLTIHVERVIE